MSEEDYKSAHEALLRERALAVERRDAASREIAKIDAVFSDMKKSIEGTLTPRGSTLPRGVLWEKVRVAVFAMRGEFGMVDLRQAVFSGAHGPGDTPRIWVALRGLKRKGVVEKVSWGRFRLVREGVERVAFGCGAPRRADSWRGRIEALLSASPGRVFSVHDVLAVLAPGVIGPEHDRTWKRVRNDLSSMSRSGEILRDSSGVGLYKAKGSLVPSVNP
jgi:hypothetical protein